MKKIELIELVQDFLAGGDAPNEIRGRYHQKVIEKYISMAYNDIVYAVYKDAKRYHQFDLLDVFTEPYFVDVQYDSDRAEYYSVLPVAIMQIPDQSAIRQISPTQDQSFSFSYIKNTDKPIWGVLEAGSLAKDVPDYYVEHLKVFYSNFDRYKDITRVLMKLIVPFNDMDWNSEVPVAAGKEMMIFEMVAKLLLQKPPDDDINDNSDIQVR